MKTSSQPGLIWIGLEVWPVSRAHLVMLAVPLVIEALYTRNSAALQKVPPSLVDHNTLITVTYLGLITTTCAAFIRVFIIRGTGLIFLSLADYQVPLWSVILRTVLLEEPFQITLVIAIVLILFDLSQRYFAVHSSINTCNSLIRRLCFSLEHKKAATDLKDEGFE